MYAQHETIKIMIQMLMINQQKRLLNFKVSKLISSDLQKIFTASQFKSHHKHAVNYL